MNNPQPTFFFYDVETSGLDPKRQRIMQFAGQRTTTGLEPIGPPMNVMVALTEEILPEPMAILVTGITPQKTLEEGYSESEFAKILHEQAFTPGTTVIGYNNVRFDDEFIRYTLWRNFHDPYEWAWAEGRSRWDLLDVIRMMRAIRPEGLEWPIDDKGNPSNRLELLTKSNSLSHESAHDALSDVMALIDLTKLVKAKQPKLFDYMFRIRDKKSVARLITPDNPQPFVYASGRYDKAYNHTTVAVTIGPGSKQGSVLVYDLRYDPEPFFNLSPAELQSSLFSRAEERRKKSLEKIPVKELSLNRCPAVAPIGVLDEGAQERIQLPLEKAEDNAAKLLGKPDFIAALAAAYALRPPFESSADVDQQLYDAFVSDKDKPAMAAVRAAGSIELSDFRPDFYDQRLEALFTRYKARNFPDSLNSSEREEWESYKTGRLQEDLPKFIKQLQNHSAAAEENGKKFLLEELQLWAESVVPAA